jgi:radical SAM superfamily enzyme YgiQ (UPF0313 family)
MNDFHLNYHLSTPFYGFGDVFPSFMFNLYLRYPKTSDGIVRYAPYPLRKIEGKLLDLGYNVKTVSPNRIHRHLSEAKILGIHTVNPLGQTFKPCVTEILQNRSVREDHSVKYFRKIVQNQHVLDAKRRGLKIIVGGAGAAQFKENQEIMEKMNIDCIVVGEAELIINEVMNDLLNDKPVPKIVDSIVSGQIPKSEQISTIKNPSSYGCVEVGRGCSRGCKFCNQTKHGFRWIPYCQIQKELEINKQAGLSYGLLQAEDVLLYGEKGVVPNREKLNKLFKLVMNYYDKFHLSHLSQAAISANEKAFTTSMELVKDKQEFMLGESGIETGSIKLIERSMSTKTKPFPTREWPDIVKNSMGVMHDNRFVPYCSYILGLPKETDYDIRKTIELMEELKDCMSLFVIINFHPLGVYRKHKSNQTDLKELDETRKELIKKASQHNIRWFDSYTRLFLKGAKYERQYYHMFQRWKKKFIQISKTYDLI